MFDLADFEAFVQTLFHDTAGAADPELPIQWPNVPFTPPNNRLWVRFAFLKEQQFPATMGRDAVHRHVGGLQVDVMVPNGQGTRAASALGSALMRPFTAREYRIADGHSVRFLGTSSDRLTAENNWERIMVRTAYWRNVTVPDA